MMITDWLDAFLDSHCRRHPRTDWPQPQTREWDRFRQGWMDAFMRLKPRPKEAEANAASAMVHNDAIERAENHASVVSDAILRARTSNQPSESADASKATPEALSRDCEFCSGSGHATIYRLDYTGEPVEQRADRTGQLKPTPLVLAAHCVCPMGRWMRAKTSQDLQRRILDLEAILAGTATGWTTDDPTLAGVSVPQGSPSEWRTFAAALVERTGVVVT